MTKKIQYRPDGFHTVNPYLLVKGAAQLLDFMKQAFGAVEIKDSSGNFWWIATHREPVSHQELQKRIDQMKKEPALKK